MGQLPREAGRLRSVCPGTQPQWALRRSKNAVSCLPTASGEVDARVLTLGSPDEGTAMQSGGVLSEDSQARRVKELKRFYSF